MNINQVINKNGKVSNIYIYIYKKIIVIVLIKKLIQFKYTKEING